MTIARATTSDELVKLRAPSQFSQLYLAIQTPAIVMACRINQSFTSVDNVAEIIYDTVTSGAYTSVLPGMTMLIGTAAGLYDIGKVRIRKVPTSSVIYIGVESGLSLVDNLYLTVVDEFALWAKHWKTISETAVLMDWDIAYTDQNLLMDPVPVLGPDIVLWKTGSTVSCTPTAANSWVIESTISGYSWSAPGSSASSNMTTATPTITYNATGQFRIGCTVTAANGKSFTGYRVVFIFDDAHLPYVPVLNKRSGDFTTGGWEFNVTLYDANVSNLLYDGAKAILFSRDVYNGTVQSVGLLSGYENIKCVGWVDEESVDHNPEQNVTKFTVRGPQYWLGLLQAYGTGFISTASTPTDWKYVKYLTVDKALWNTLQWRSTVSSIMDIYITGDTRTNAGIVAPTGSIWSQLQYMGAKIFAYPVCNKFGQLFVEIDTQMVLSTDRSGFPIVMGITSQDWRGDDNVALNRRVTPPTSLIDLGGTGDTETETYFSRAPGSAFGRYGKIITLNNLMITDQAQANLLSGYAFAKEVNEYPSISIPFALNNELIDIAPRQFLTLTVDRGDVKLQAVWSAKKIIARRIEYTHSLDDGTMLCMIECEAETIGISGVTVIPPKPIIDNIPPVTPVTPGPYPGWNPIPWFPPITPPPGSDNPCIHDTNLHNYYNLTFDKSTIANGEDSYCYFPCKIRAGAAAGYKTDVYVLADYNIPEAVNHFTLVAVDGSKATILSPSSVTRDTEGGHWEYKWVGAYPSLHQEWVWIPGHANYVMFTFDPVSCTPVNGFKLSVEPEITVQEAIERLLAGAA